jgi:hypothetical protein
VTIPCQNAPGGVPAGDGGTIQDDGGPDKDTGVKEEVACAVNVNVHKPISLAPDEPVIPEDEEEDGGATTLRNDDSDWRVGGEAPGLLPIINLPTDLEHNGNPDENDLVRVDAINPQNLPGVYVFAFPTHAEGSLDLAARVDPITNGRHANEHELGYFPTATKGGEAFALPLIVPAGALTFWLEPKLGGRYRMVIGKLAVGVNPAEVEYDVTDKYAYVMRDKKKEKAFICDDQATVTAAVVDIYQMHLNHLSRRMTAFDVYWGGRPHFRAEVWPGAQQFAWGPKYRLGAAERSMPGTAVTGEVASMKADDEDVDEDSNASRKAEKVKATGKAKGDFATKGRIEGGFVMDRPGGDNPVVNEDHDNRYPDRVTLGYTVNGEQLVRAEYLEMILPQVKPPAVPRRMGTPLRVASEVHYEIVDAFDRPIIADSIGDYVQLYGAGLKAWEALDEDPGRVIERGPSRDRKGVPRPDKYNDYLYLTNTGLDLKGDPRPAVGPLGTAQRSQTLVREDRMKAGTFQDTLIFNAPNDADQREALWKASTGRPTARDLARAVAEADDRDNALAGRVEPGKRFETEQKRLDYIQARRDAVAAADEARIMRSTILSIPQDVILQLRVGQERYDLMVYEENRLNVLSPYFFNDNKYQGNKDDAVFRYHLTFVPGTEVSRLVRERHRRQPAPR